MTQRTADSLSDKLGQIDVVRMARLPLVAYDLLDCSSILRVALLHDPDEPEYIIAVLNMLKTQELATIIHTRVTRMYTIKPRLEFHSDEEVMVVARHGKDESRRRISW